MMSETEHPVVVCTDCESIVRLTWPVDKGFPQVRFECDCRTVNPMYTPPKEWERMTIGDEQ